MPTCCTGSLVIVWTGTGNLVKERTGTPTGEDSIGEGAGSRVQLQPDAHELGNGLGLFKLAMLPSLLQPKKPG